MKDWKDGSFNNEDSENWGPERWGLLFKGTQQIHGRAGIGTPAHPPTPPQSRAWLQMTDPPCLSQASLFPTQLTALLLYPGDSCPPGSDPGTDTWSRSPLQGLRSVRVTSSHLQATSTKAHFSLPLVMPLRKEHWASHKVEGAAGKAQGLGKCPWVGHSPLGVKASSSMKGLIMSSLPAS